MSQPPAPAPHPAQPPPDSVELPAQQLPTSGASSPLLRRCHHLPLGKFWPFPGPKALPMVCTLALSLQLSHPLRDKSPGAWSTSLSHLSSLSATLVIQLCTALLSLPESTNPCPSLQGSGMAAPPRTLPPVPMGLE